MLRAAYEDAGVDPKKVAYIEAHGTGTPVGDPIETNAFGNIIGKERAEDNKCVIGSVKSNIGHLEAAAGIAGFIKLALVLKNKQIPKNLHFENPNPKIPFDKYRLRVPTALEDLPENGTPAIAGVNSFGAGGTNAHVVMQAYRKSETKNNTNKQSESDIQLFTLSGKSLNALKGNATNYIEYLNTTKSSLKNICYSTAKRRSAFEHRLATSVKSKKELISNLEAFIKDETRPGMTYNKVGETKKRKVGFIFSGQGPQWYAMGQQLIKSNPLFKETILKIDALFSKIADWSLLDEMNKDESTSNVSDTKIAQPAIMAIQIALTELWKSWGVTPEGCVGHSIGEVAAAYAVGSLTLEQAVEVIYHRSRGQHQATDKGKMLAVGLPLVKVKAAIADFEDRISIAAINGPNMVALSGDVEPLETIAATLDKKDIFYKFLRVNVPFHSHHMEPLKDDLINSLKDLSPSAASISLYSTVTGKQEDGNHLTSEYWYQNVREPVYFTDAIQSMINDGFDTFIEIAPHPILTAGTTELLENNKIKHGLVVPSLRRKEDEAIISMGSLGILFTNDYQINWNQIFSESSQYVKLPKYAWQHESHWFESKKHRESRLGTKIHPHLGTHTQSITDESRFIWNLELDQSIHTYVEDHKIDGTIIFPGTGHLEVATAVGKASYGEQFSFLEDVHFNSALFLPDEGETPDICLEISSDEGSYHIATRPKEEDAAWTKHSKGRINYLEDAFASQPLDLSVIQERLHKTVSVPDFYIAMKEGGLQYGEAFRCIQKLWTGENELLSAVQTSSKVHYGIDKFNFHPTLFDACLHTIMYAGNWATESKQAGIYIPVHINRYKVHTNPGTKVWCYVKVTEASESYLIGDYWIFNEDKELVAEIQQLTCKYVEGSRRSDDQDLYKGMFEYKWELQEESGISTDKSTVKNKEGFVIFADSKQQSKNLVAEFDNHSITPIVIEKGEHYKVIDKNHYVVNPDKQEEITNAFKQINEQNISIQKAVYLWTLDTDNHIYLSAEEMQEQQGKMATHLLNTLKSIINLDNEPAFSIITQGAANVSGNDKVNINQGAIYGTGRVLINEYPFISTNIIDLSFRPSSTEWVTLFNVITKSAKDKISECALRDSKIYSRVLNAVIEEKAEENASKMLPAVQTPYRTFINEYGMMDSLVFRDFNRTAPKKGEVEIEVHAAGLNFKDVMNVMGLLNAEAVSGGIAGANLGLESSGTITAVGENVKGLKVGDEVMAWTSDSFAGYTIAKDSCVVKKPTNLSFEEAATLTVVFLTAYYSLDYLGRISGEDTVLIHSATGGVGLAAIQIAQLMGAKIIATAGTEEKRQYLKDKGIEHVFDSRSLTFADGVMRATKGKGVDIVLNSLSGKGIIQGIKCLAPFGKFIELGKVDVYNDSKLALKRFGENLSFHVVDLDRLMLQKPVLGKRMFQNLADLFESKKLVALPSRSYHISDISDAIKYLSKGIHIGKVVVTMDETPIKVYPSKSMKFEADATYLITGGASGFGLMLAKWIADKGAQHLVLLSRSGTKYESDVKVIREMEASGVEVNLMKVDVTNQSQLSLTANIIRDTMPPLKGVIHSAAVINDMGIPDTTQNEFMSAFKPKAIGAWNLHLATQKDELDFFVMLSSISSIFGFPGQANYSSANTFLDTLAEYRQSAGLKGTAINLGVMDTFAGMSKEGEDSVLKVLTNQGWLLMSLKQITNKVENVILHQPTHRMTASLDWKKFKGFYSNLINDSRFEKVIAEATAKGGQLGNGKSSLIDKILNAPEEEKTSLLTVKLAESLAKILGTSSDKIEVDISISKIGLDSLMLNQLRNWIQQKLEINYPLMRIAKGPSIMELADQLLIALKKTIASEEEVDTSGITSESDIEVVDEWFVRNTNNQQEIKKRLFCIHPVGAGASMFSHFIYNPPKDTDVIALQLPGRENRIDEKPFEDMQALIPELAKAMMPLLDKPFVILGHSFGGIIGFELIRYLRKNYGIHAEHFFVTGTIAPHLSKTWKDRDVISETAIESNSEEKLLSLMNYIDDVEFLKQILPVMKKDMPLIMSYFYEEDKKFDFPITGFAAEQDEVVLVKELAEWKFQTNNEFSLEVVDGDHWFLSRNKELILGRLNEVFSKLKIDTTLEKV